MLTTQDIPETFFVDLAIGTRSFDVICDAHNLTPADVKALDADPVFTKRRLQAEQSVLDDGRAFRARCRLIVNDTVNHIENLMRDPETPATVQLDAFKTLVKFGDLELQRQTAAAGGPSLSLTIIAPSGEVHATLLAPDPTPIHSMPTLPAEALLFGAE